MRNTLDFFMKAHPSEVIEAYAEDGSLHQSIAQEIEGLNAEIAELTRDRITVSEAVRQLNEAVRERHRAEVFLERAGYRQCDIPACNCGSWHRHRTDETSDV